MLSCIVTDGLAKIPKCAGDDFAADMDIGIDVLWPFFYIVAGSDNFIIIPEKANSDSRIVTDKCTIKIGKPFSKGTVDNIGVLSGSLLIPCVGYTMPVFVKDD